jgi:transcription elongation factor GreA
MVGALYLTQEGLDKLHSELAELKGRRKEVVKRIQDAKDFGDLSENSEYEDAKNEQAFVEGRIQEVEEVLRMAKVAQRQKGSKSGVDLGCTVTVVVEGGEETYQIVGATEANPIKGKISIDSPTGKAFLGKNAGDKVLVETPSGKIEYKIKSLS